MKFVNPNFLFALFTATIPIIIHLFNFRKYKTVYFSNVRFLKEIKEQTQSKSQLKHLLVLISRILTIFFLVFAFAQPFIPLKNTSQTFNSNTTSVYVDNSFSMNAIGESGQLIDFAKNIAIDISKSFLPSDKFQLLTNNFLGKHQRLVNKDQFNDYIDEINISAETKKLSQVIERQKNLLKNEKNSDRKIFIISDFQKSTSDFESLENDTSYSVFLIPLKKNEEKNIYIDSIWFESPIRQIGRAHV